VFFSPGFPVLPFTAKPSGCPSDKPVIFPDEVSIPVSPFCLSFVGLGSIPAFPRFPFSMPRSATFPGFPFLSSAGLTQSLKNFWNSRFQIERILVPDFPGSNFGAFGEQTFRFVRSGCGPN
jgi:hypothetical protein